MSTVRSSQRKNVSYIPGVLLESLNLSFPSCEIRLGSPGGSPGAPPTFVRTAVMTDEGAQLCSLGASSWGEVGGRAAGAWHRCRGLGLGRTEPHAGRALDPRASGDAGSARGSLQRAQRKNGKYAHQATEVYD